MMLHIDPRQPELLCRRLTGFGAFFAVEWHLWYFRYFRALEQHANEQSLEMFNNPNAANQGARVVAEVAEERPPWAPLAA